jgi:3-dehydroquinate synthetase
VERLLIGERSEIVIDRGLASGDILPGRADREKVAVFTQPGAAHIAELVVAGLDSVDVQEMMLPDRDTAKTLAVAETAYEWLAEMGMSRHDTIVGVGGGSVTDVAGFVAATYLRGIESVHVPTTLLGAVDAAIGGKTGVNLGGKNLVGAFHLPTRVVIDLDVLDELPTELKREGMAETLKAGLIGDPGLFSHLELAGLEADLALVVPRAAAVKVAVVGQDFRETGLRETLNYGHTIGHAVEIAGGMSHGHAVAIGMAAAGCIAEDLVGFADADRQLRAIAGLGLPVHTEGLPRQRVLDVLAQDKKRDVSGLRMVLLRSIGEPVVVPVSGETINMGLSSIGIR